ncbi:pseudouridine synthase domain protein [Francisella tularensis subsp. novicida]|nr:pseudouridine synthase domain protein [Francisella tularensis subsp. novicida]
MRRANQNNDKNPERLQKLLAKYGIGSRRKIRRVYRAR